MNKTGKPYATVINNKREKIQVNTIRNEIFKKLWQHRNAKDHKWPLCACQKMDNLEEIDKFLEMYNIPNLYQEEIENVKQSNHKQEDQNCNKNIPTNKSPGPCGFMCFPDSSVGKESACSAEDLGSIPGLGRSSGEGKD